ncbi:MAG: hypothetical protein QXN37_02270 [Candidatus Anstonellaceae archaeon]
MSNYVLVATAMLASAAFVLQLSNNFVGLPTGFGMTIDLVAVPTILALFLFGFLPSLEVLFLSTIFIALFASSGPIGASMKFGATAPTLLVFGLYSFLRSRKINHPFVLVLLFSLIFGLLVFALGAFSYSLLWAEGKLLAGIFPIISMALLMFLLYALFENQKSKSFSHLFQDSKTILLLAPIAIVIRGISMVVANFYFAGPLYFKMTTEQFVELVSSSDLLFFGSGAIWYIAIFFFNAIQAAVELGLAWLIAFKLGFARKYSSC